MTYRILRLLVRLAVRVFFRRVEVAGLGHLPRTGPLLVLANHGNGLVDPLLLLALCPRPVRIVTKHTLWDIPALGPVLDAVRAIPVHRTGEDPEASRRNEAFFQECANELAAGGAVAIFPEGKSHGEPALQPLRTGAARIALRALERRAAPAVVPVGLTYESKEQFRSDLVVLVGFPVQMGGRFTGPEPVEGADRVEAEPEGAEVRRLTRRFGVALGELIVGLGTWEEHRLLAQLVALSDPAPAAEDALRRRLVLARGYAALLPERAAELAALRDDLERLVRRCRALRISPERLERRYRLPAVAWHALPCLEILLLGMPLGIWGLVNSYLPYRATGALARRISRDTDQVAMFKLLGTLLFFPLFYGLHTAIVWAVLGLLAAVVYLLLLVHRGYYALPWWELGLTFQEEAATLVRIVARSDEVEALRRERGAILARIDALARQLEPEGAVRP